METRLKTKQETKQGTSKFIKKSI